MRRSGVGDTRRASSSSGAPGDEPEKTCAAVYSDQ
jgi:hypothetical protein